MNVLSYILSDKVTLALGWNIVHILWQGLLVALILAIIMRFLKGKSAQLRYLICIFSLFLILGLSIFNFYAGYTNTVESFEHANSAAETSSLKNLTITESDRSNAELLYTHYFQNVKTWFKGAKKYFPVIVNIWLLGILFFIIKLILSHLYTNRLKLIQTSTIAENWLEKFQQIEENIRIKKSVRYIESKLIKVPIVLGYFKPVIIVPFGMLLGIPSNQIEAIIAHELAHIRRNDYIVNVIQTIIETIFFFHPAIWYISSQIRNERENCCDDIALTVCKESIVYAKALVSVQELNLGRYYTAVAFSGRKKHLLNRIKRMIMKPKVKSNYKDRIIASAIILVGIAALSFTYKANMEGIGSKSELFKPNTTKSISENPTPVIKKDTTVKNVKHVHKVKHDNMHDLTIDGNTVSVTNKTNGKTEEMKFTLDNGKVGELYIDGKKIPEKDYDKYQDKIDDTIADLKEAKIDIKDAMKDIEELDIEKIRLEIEEAMKDVHIDVDKIEEDIARAMESMDEIDMEDIMQNIEINLDHLKDFDFDFDFDFEFDGDQFKIDAEKIHEEIEKAKESIKNELDTEAFKEEMLQIHKELSKIHEEEIKIQLEESLKHIEKIDKKKIEKDLQEKLEELEALELEEK